MQSADIITYQHNNSGAGVIPADVIAECGRRRVHGEAEWCNGSPLNKHRCVCMSESPCRVGSRPKWRPASPAWRGEAHTDRQRSTECTFQRRRGQNRRHGSPDRNMPSYPRAEYQKYQPETDWFITLVCILQGNLLLLSQKKQTVEVPRPSLKKVSKVKVKNKGIKIKVLI